MKKKENKNCRVVGLTTKSVHELLKKFMKYENRTESATIHIALEKFLTEYYGKPNSLKK